MNDTTSETVISKLKAHFARYGIPEKIIRDNGPQLASRQFENFCRSYSITHETSSPGNSKANGAAEAAVKVAKNMMKKCYTNKEDPYMALLNIRNTPNEGLDYSPAQRLIGRRTRTILPTKPSLLVPELPQKQKLINQREKLQSKMSNTYINRHSLSPLKINDTVRMQPIDGSSKWNEATVKTPTSNSRSYIVETENGQQYRRDRQFLRKKPSKSRESKNNEVAPNTA